MLLPTPILQAYMERALALCLLLDVMSEYTTDPGRLWQDIQEQLGGYLQVALDSSERHRAMALELSRLSSQMLDVLPRLSAARQAGDRQGADKEQQELDRLTVEINQKKQQLQEGYIPFPTVPELIEKLRMPQ